jgi:glyoxylase-like metal-dependent hydrolase (beta-lactamase superfamily II)
LVSTAVLLLLLASGPGAQDARTVLQAVSKNIGADNLTTLEITGSKGFHAFPGASYSPEVDWTRFQLVGYSKAIDFNNRYQREQITRTWGSYSRLGGAQGVPNEGNDTLDMVVSGDAAWLAQGAGGPLEREGYMDGVPIVDLWKLNILLTPHGFIKAALAPGANPTMVVTGPRGQKLTYVSIMAMGKYRVTATINERQEIELLQTHVANPMFGDMLYEYHYGPYKQFGSVKFPSLIRHNEGDPRVYAGHSMMEVEITAATANAPLQLLPVPAALKVPEDVRAMKSDKAGEGVYFIAGIRHGSVAIEFRDFVTVFEAPLNEKRSIAVIDEVHRLIPDKPIRYLINSHHHFDHAGGIRTYVAEGAKIVAHERAREFYENVVLSPTPRNLEPDRLYLLNPGSYRASAVEPVPANGKYTITDGTRVLEVHPVPFNTHATTTVLAYLPQERVAMFGDGGAADALRIGLNPAIAISSHGGVSKVQPPGPNAAPPK